MDKNKQLQNLAEEFFGEWAIIASDIPAVVKTFARYLRSEKGLTLNITDEAWERYTAGWFAKRLSPAGRR